MRGCVGINIIDWIERFAARHYEAIEVSAQVEVDTVGHIIYTIVQRSVCRVVHWRARIRKRLEIIMRIH